jgi:hypothetical protein
MTCVGLYGEIFDRERACCGCTGDAGVEGNDVETSFSNEDVDR